MGRELRQRAAPEVQHERDQQVVGVRSSCDERDLRQSLPGLQVCQWREAPSRTVRDPVSWLFVRLLCHLFHSNRLDQL